ncbi:Peptidase C1A, papain C-terminal [Sesbania bispinosa]|nr:Peptidase C1A, papain C-terminal [Sesbania bispinosa]
MSQYGKVYKDAYEKEKRFQIFKKNVEFIESFNAARDQPFNLSINQFADLESEEFKASLNGQKKPRGLETATETSFSEGCNGGYMEDAFEFIVKKGGIASEAFYPYKDINRTCRVKKEIQHAARIKGFEKVPANSEMALLKAVANQPVSVYIDAGAGGSAFQFYSSGIFTGKCGTDLNHSVTIVGYGETHDGTKYWLVKNSWGTDWGEEGYIRMKRDTHAKEGLCGIAMGPTYPVV